MRIAAFALMALLAPGTDAPPAGAPSSPPRIVLTLPRAPAAGEAVWLRVRVGVLPRGARVLVLSDDGTLLGAISPFAIPPGQKAGTYTIPLPEKALREGRVTVRLVVEETGQVTRSSTTGEIEEVGLVHVPVTR